MALEHYIRDRLQTRKILLMTHAVIGYPTLEESFRIVGMMVEAGVDLVELQIPCSRPEADGPVIVRANQEALREGVSVQDCLDLAGQAVRSFPIPVLAMAYYETLSHYGVMGFVSDMANRGLVGAIIPDLPMREAGPYLKAMGEHGLSPILFFTPSTSSEEMRRIDSAARGFIYCVARKGPTGAETIFGRAVTLYLGRCRLASHLPLAVGFGIRRREQVSYLKGKAEIAVIGTQIIRSFEEGGPAGVGEFIRGLYAEG